MSSPLSQRLAQRKVRRGASAIEFGLWVPVIMALFAGVVDISRFISLQHTIQRAARDAARSGSSLTRALSGAGTATEADIEGTASTHARNVLVDSGLPCATGCTITSTWAFSTVSDSWVLSVRVTYPFTPLIGLLPMLNGSVSKDFTMLTQTQP